MDAHAPLLDDAADQQLEAGSYYSSYYSEQSLPPPPPIKVRGMPRSHGGVPQANQKKLRLPIRRAQLFVPCFIFVHGTITALAYFWSLLLIVTCIFAPYGLAVTNIINDFVLRGDINFSRWSKKRNVISSMVEFNVYFLSPLLAVVMAAALLLMFVQAVVFLPAMFAVCLCIPLPEEFNFLNEFLDSYVQAVQFGWTVTIWMAFPILKPLKIWGAPRPSKSARGRKVRWQPDYGAMYGNVDQRMAWEADAAAHAPLLAGAQAPPSRQASVRSKQSTARTARSSGSSRAATAVPVLVMPDGQAIPYADYLAATQGAVDGAAGVGVPPADLAAAPLASTAVNGHALDHAVAVPAAADARDTVTISEVKSSLADGDTAASEGLTTAESEAYDTASHSSGESAPASARRAPPNEFAPLAVQSGGEEADRRSARSGRYARQGGAVKPGL